MKILFNFPVVIAVFVSAFVGMMPADSHGAKDKPITLILDMTGHLTESWRDRVFETFEKRMPESSTRYARIKIPVDLSKVVKSLTLENEKISRLIVDAHGNALESGFEIAINREVASHEEAFRIYGTTTLRFLEQYDSRYFIRNGYSSDHYVHRTLNNLLSPFKKLFSKSPKIYFVSCKVLEGASEASIKKRALLLLKAFGLKSATLYMNTDIGFAASLDDTYRNAVNKKIISEGIQPGYSIEVDRGEVKHFHQSTAYDFLDTKFYPDRLDNSTCSDIVKTEKPAGSHTVLLN